MGYMTYLELAKTQTSLNLFLGVIFISYVVYVCMSFS